MPLDPRLRGDDELQFSEKMQKISTRFIFLRHPRAGGDPDGNFAEAITIFTQAKASNVPLEPRLRGDDGEAC